MIVEVVEFQLPPGTSRDKAIALFRQAAPVWAANADLVEKRYLYDESRCVGGGIYVWRTREAAARWHGSDYVAMIAQRYGSAPRVTVYDSPMRIDAVSREIEMT